MDIVINIITGAVLIIETLKQQQQNEKLFLI